MAACSACGATLTIGASDCAACGTAVPVEPAAARQGDALEPGIGIAANLWRGNYALAKTYWLFGFLGGIALGLAVGVGIAFTQSGVLALSGIAALWAWQVFIAVAIWRSAGRYTGPRVWAVLARLALALGALQLVGATVELFRTVAG